MIHSDLPEDDPCWGPPYAPDPDSLAMHNLQQYLDDKYTPSCEESITNLKPFAFYADVPWTTQRDELRTLLDRYFDKYVVGFETSKVDKVPHIHVLAETDSGQYQAFIAKLKKQYKLSGRATKGNRKQYGKVKVIKDFNNMFSYTIKSGDYHYRGYDQDYVQERLDKSYEKQTLKDKFTKICDKMKNYVHAMNCAISEEPCDLQLKQDERLHIVETLIQLHHEEYKTILGTPQLKRYLYTLGLLKTKDIAHQIGDFWIKEFSFL